MRLVSQTPVRRRLEPGDRVDDHLIIRSVLGKGGTAVVFEALHTRLSSLVALKVVDVDEAYASDAAARLEREAVVCAAIDDPHIPKIYDVGQLEDGTPYIVMEKLAGPTLENMLEEGPIRPRVALAIVRDLLSALSAVHRVSVVHRDIKPSNLIVQTAEDGAYRVRLMDFGVSKAMSNHRSDPAITHEGALVGTPHYMAPEQMSDEGVDARTDVYAAGVLLYELLANRLPFDGGSTAEVMGAVLRHTHVPLSTWCPHLPTSLCALVARAMAERPEDRFASAREMRDALDTATAALGAQARAHRSSGSVLASRNMIAWSLLSVTVAFLLALGSRYAIGPSAAGNVAAVQTSSLIPSPTAESTAAPSSPEPVDLVQPKRRAAPTDAHPSVKVKARPIARAAIAARTSKAALRAPASPALPASAAPLEAAPTNEEAQSLTPAEVAVSQGVIVSDYVRQLDELGRVVSDVAASLDDTVAAQADMPEANPPASEALEPLDDPGPLPVNPYQ